MLMMIKFEFTPFMEKLGINQHMLSVLLQVSKTSISQWVKAGAIPEKHLPTITAITAEDAAQVHTWMPYDLLSLRSKLGMWQSELARHLKSSQAIVSHWERDGKIPRDRLPLIQELEALLPKQQACA